MTITATDLISQSQAQNGGTDTSKTKTNNAASTLLSGNYETFIKLLTSQLQNQDPLDPTDTAQFTQQLVMYSQVEQQISTNSKLDDVLGNLTNASATQFVGYLGKEVEVASDKLLLKDGKSKISYTLPDNAENVKIEVKNSSGATIATLSGDKTVGTHAITWDGKTAAGSQMADAIYSFTVTATDKDNKAIKNVQQFYVGTVKSIQSTASGAAFDFGGLYASPNDVISISEI